MPIENDARAQRAAFLRQSIEAQREGRYREDGKRYRLMLFQRPSGPWHRSKGAAEDYALKRKLASREPDSAVTYLTVPAWIAADDNPIFRK